MDNKKKPSGAFKRKQRQEREDSKQKLPKIDKFFSQPSAIGDTSAADHVNVDDVCMAHIKAEDLKEPQTSTFFENVYDKSSYDLGNITNKILSDNENVKFLIWGLYSLQDLFQQTSTRIIDVIRYHTYPSKEFFALRGHREDLSQEQYHGNFLSFVELVARYDHILRQVLDMPKGFYAAIKHGAADLVHQATILFIDKNIDLKKCVGQGYDGASVMSGVYNGVQKYIMDIQPNAEYVHCATHNLNLVINDAVSSCVEIQIFFATLQDLYNFFGNSIKRWDLLSKFTGESDITLKKLNPTRWPNQGKLELKPSPSLVQCDLERLLNTIDTDVVRRTDGVHSLVQEASDLGGQDSNLRSHQRIADLLEGNMISIGNGINMMKEREKATGTLTD
ncbi:hypothetical protein EVAR_97035_1 [Eumeta japonica]|uniref:Zinc finger MYM-type protein 1 n=1 Tax=Eumeta variegata TaxID=151549 RepID=A0A4C1WK08_EUMVA|nr:hypothetical protein EVAR_97035_1 [Eumeta japonica]